MAVDFRWKDPGLAWNLSQYGNISTLILPDSSIWKPSIALANPVDRSLLFPEDDFDVRVYFTGDVIWIMAGTVSTMCKPFVKYYPFDVHTCSIKLFPMSHTLREIQLTPTLKMDVFDNFGQWNLFNERVHTEILDVFSLASFDFSIKRRPEFSLLSLCIPILFLGVLNSCVFLIPPDSGERISYAITVLLSFAVFMTIISANMPKNSDPVPVLCYVLMVMMTESGVIVILTIYGLRLHFRTEKRPIPRLLRLTAGLFGHKSASESNGNACNSENLAEGQEGNERTNESGKSWKRIAEIYDKILLVASFFVFFVTLIWYVVAVNTK
ncbi:hypothetical protein FSP39_005847 [Pinctada imbricata]|uniref:Uncharacterized protein n=1 Tax=Pinctada imbricata TaxID=66713 RepID=A0AA88Y559_PINIB|nr:hypothetical protein FSP39_005847 [Pinctada imbricata]